MGVFSYMNNFNESIVSIIKCAEHDNYDLIKKSVKNCIDLIGGLESIISPGDTVLIKPNLLCPSLYTTGATTNPYIVKAVVELCKEVKASKIVIGEGSAVGHNTIEAFEVCGIKNIAEELNCALVDFTKDDYQYVINPIAKKFKRIRIPKSFLEANVVINIPVMKTHDVLNVTLGLKNIKGIIQTSDKKRFHKWGLAQSLIDLNQIALPQLTILDGTIAMEGNGPVAGNPVGLGLILASKDTVACDRVGCEIMGFNEDEIDYIKQAGKENLGCFDINKISVVGEKIANVKKIFKRTNVNEEELEKYRITLVSCDACSGCNHTVKNYIVSLENKKNLGLLENSTVIYGQGAYIPENINKRIIRVGTCTRNLCDTDSLYIPGCPPHPHDIQAKLTNKDH